MIESDLEAVKRLVPKQARRSPFHCTSDAHTPLRLAVRRGKVSVVKLLLNQNVPANEYLLMFQPGNGLSVFSEAIQQGNTEIVQLLIAADVTIEDDSSAFVPVENAIYKGKPVDEILKSYQTRFFAEDVDYKRLAEERKAMLQELLEIGLVEQIRIPEANANCPLAVAIHAGRAKVVAAILEGGANPNILIGGKTL